MAPNRLKMKGKTALFSRYKRQLDRFSHLSNCTLCIAFHLFMKIQTFFFICLVLLVSFRPLFVILIIVVISNAQRLRSCCAHTLNKTMRERERAHRRHMSFAKIKTSKKCHRIAFHSRPNGIGFMIVCIVHRHMC